MEFSLAPLGQILRKLWFFKFGNSRSHFQTTVIPGWCPKTANHLICHISKLTPPIRVFLSIVGCTCHKLCIGLGLTLVPHSLHGWKAFSMPGALAHTWITWALSPMASQVSGVTRGSLLCPWCFGQSSWRGTRHAKRKCVFGPKKWDQKVLEGEVGALPQVQRAYMGDAVFPIKPTRGRMTRPTGLWSNMETKLASMLHVVTLATPLNNLADWHF